MTSTAATRRTGKMTEYLSLPEDLPWVEYVDGVAEEKRVGDYEHGVVQAELGTMLGMYRRLHGGRVVTEARARYRRPGAGSDYRLPDIAFYPRGTVARPAGERVMQPLALAIEIRSQDESLASQRAKCRWYLAHGVSECWLIDPYRRTFEVFDATRDGVPFSDIVTSPLLPGFELSLPDLFATLDDDEAWATQAR